MKRSKIIYFISSVYLSITFSINAENELKSIEDLNHLNISLLVENIGQSSPQLRSIIDKYIGSDNIQFLTLSDDSNEVKPQLLLTCDENDINCSMRSSENTCPHNYVLALVHGNSVIIINDGLISNTGLTPEKLRNMINIGAITCVPIQLTSKRPIETTTTTTPSPVTLPSASSSEDVNKIILILLLNLMNQNKNNNNEAQSPNPCPTCSCKNCGTSSSSNTGTDAGNAFSQLANAIIGMEQLKFDLIKNKINVDAQLLGSKLNINLNLIKSKMGLQQALVNALLGSLNSIGPNHDSNHLKQQHKDSRVDKSLNNEPILHL